jgi:hypothetical protein
VLCIWRCRELGNLRSGFYSGVGGYLGSQRGRAGHGIRVDIARANKCIGLRDRGPISWHRQGSHSAWSWRARVHLRGSNHGVDVRSRKLGRPERKRDRGCIGFPSTDSDVA